MARMITTAVLAVTALAVGAWPLLAQEVDQFLISPQPKQLLSMQELMALGSGSDEHVADPPNSYINNNSARLIRRAQGLWQYDASLSGVVGGPYDEISIALRLIRPF